jgi:hypothetical protein
MRSALFLISGFISAGCLAAQSPTVASPVEGYTFDAPTHSLRAVYGFPGASTFGPPLRTSLEFASVAPHQTYAIGFQKTESLLISGLGSSKLTARTLAGIEAQPDGIAWSANGSLAVLYSLSGNWLQTISGLPSAPAVGKRVEGSTLGGTLVSVAADAQGKEVAAGVTGDAGAVYESSDGQNFTSLKQVAKPISLAFSTATGTSDSTTLYVLDSSLPQVVAINLSSHGYQAIPLDGLANPIAIQTVQNSQSIQQLYVAAASSVRILDIATQQTVADVPLSFKATGLGQFGGTSFIVAARVKTTNPLWLFSSTPQPGAYFVPAIQSPSPAHGRAGLIGGDR